MVTLRHFGGYLRPPRHAVGVEAVETIPNPEVLSVTDNLDGGQVSPRFLSEPFGELGNMLRAHALAALGAAVSTDLLQTEKRQPNVVVHAVLQSQGKDARARAA